MTLLVWLDDVLASRADDLIEELRTRGFGPEAVALVDSIGQVLDLRRNRRGTSELGSDARSQSPARPNERSA